MAGTPKRRQVRAQNQRQQIDRPIQRRPQRAASSSAGGASATDRLGFARQRSADRNHTAAPRTSTASSMARRAAPIRRGARSITLAPPGPPLLPRRQGAYRQRGGFHGHGGRAIRPDRYRRQEKRPRSDGRDIPHKFDGFPAPFQRALGGLPGGQFKPGGLQRGGFHVYRGLRGRLHHHAVVRGPVKGNLRGADRAARGNRPRLVTWVTL